MNDVLVFALESKLVIRFYDKNQLRVVEPFCRTRSTDVRTIAIRVIA